MQARDLSRITAADRRTCAQIGIDAGVNFKDCYQCGKCTAGCPLSESMDLMPREVIRFLQLGDAETVLSSKTPWICAQCDVCSTRCPQNVDVCSTMRAVRLASKNAGKQPVPEADIFEEVFIDNVKAHGVSNEQYLAARYNLKSGHIMQDMGNAVRMLQRKLVGVAMHNTKGRADVAAVIDRALEADAARRAEVAAAAKEEGGEA